MLDTGVVGTGGDPHVILAPATEGLGMKGKRRGHQDLELEGPPELDPRLVRGGAHGGQAPQRGRGGAGTGVAEGGGARASPAQSPAKGLGGRCGRGHSAPRAALRASACSHHAPAGSEPHTTTSAHQAKPPGPTPPVPHHPDPAVGTLVALAFGPRTAIWHLCLTRLLRPCHSGTLTQPLPPTPPHPTMRGTC